MPDMDYLASRFNSNLDRFVVRSKNTLDFIVDTGDAMGLDHSDLHLSTSPDPLLICSTELRGTALQWFWLYWPRRIWFFLNLLKLLADSALWDAFCSSSNLVWIRIGFEYSLRVNLCFGNSILEIGLLCETFYQILSARHKPPFEPIWGIFLIWPFLVLPVKSISWSTVRDIAPPFIFFTSYASCI